ncbi:MAG: hypothetical protein R3B49_09405 [Phycisphaerales bacterium]
MIGTILAVAGLVVGCTAVVLVGFWIYRKIFRKINGPPPPRQPTQYDLDKIKWDFPTIMAALVASMITGGGMFAIAAYVNPGRRATGFFVLLVVGIAWGAFLAMRWMIRKIAMPSPDEYDYR